MVQAIQKLQPEGVPPNPHTVPPREWHQFIVLYNSYVLDELNRDIISQLYIGEGTFNRTRRRALQGVAKALQDMELEALKPADTQMRSRLDFSHARRKRDSRNPDGCPRVPAREDDCGHDGGENQPAEWMPACDGHDGSEARLAVLGGLWS